MILELDIRSLSLHSIPILLIIIAKYVCDCKVGSMSDWIGEAKSSCLLIAFYVGASYRSSRRPTVAIILLRLFYFCIVVRKFDIYVILEFSLCKLYASIRPSFHRRRIYNNVWNSFSLLYFNYYNFYLTFSTIRQRFPFYFRLRLKKILHDLNLPFFVTIVFLLLKSFFFFFNTCYC